MPMLVQVLVGVVLIVAVGGAAALVSMALQRRSRASRDFAYRHRPPHDLRVTAREAERPYPPDPEEPAR